MAAEHHAEVEEHLFERLVVDQDTADGIENPLPLALDQPAKSSSLLLK